MRIVFLIDDDFHSEGISEHATFAEAEIEIQRLVTLPLDAEPNFPSCGRIDTCGRRYEIVKYKIDSTNQWIELERTPIVELRISGIKWLR